MKRTLLLMVGAAIALLVGTTAIAATTSGKVVATDALTHSITIQTDAGARFLFTRNDATRIEQKGMDVAAGDLRMETRITVTTEQTPTDPLIPMLATRVQVEEMAVAAPAPDSELDAGAARVESAGKNGGAPIHTAQVQSADSPLATERLAKPLPLLAAVVAGLLLAGAVYMLRRGGRGRPAS